MEQKLIDEFARDLQHAHLECLFEEPGLWESIQTDNSLYEEGPYVNIGVDVSDFIETLPMNNHMDLAGYQFENLNIWGGEVTYECSSNVTLKDAKIRYNWDDVEEEDEPEEEFEDLQYQPIIIHVRYDDWKLTKIDCRVLVDDGEHEYSLWPEYNFPDSFSGKFGEIEEGRIGSVLFDL